MLTIRSLSKTYPGGVEALRDVDLDIPAGMFGLLGPNGAGKSTLMRTLATLQDADSGTARLGELDLLADKPRVREILGYLPQDFGVYPKTTAYDLLDHFAVLKGLVDKGPRRDAVEQLLRLVNLWSVRNRRLGTFSGGMRQRFGIAQALLAEPQLVIVDEPTAGLDPQERNRFLDLLSAIGEDVVVILSTHIVEDVRDLCSRMAILAGGRVLEQGAPHELIDGLRGRIWRRVVDGDEAARLAAELPVISDRLFAGQRALHVVADTAPEGFDAAAPSLEDVYFSALIEAGAREVRADAA